MPGDIWDQAASAPSPQQAGDIWDQAAKPQSDDIWPGVGDQPWSAEGTAKTMGNQAWRAVKAGGKMLGGLAGMVTSPVEGAKGLVEPFSHLAGPMPTSFGNPAESKSQWAPLASSQAESMTPAPVAPGHALEGIPVVGQLAQGNIPEATGEAGALAGLGALGKAGANIAARTTRWNPMGTALQYASRAVKPAPADQFFEGDMTRALADIKSREQQLGRPIGGVYGPNKLLRASEAEQLKDAIQQADAQLKDRVAEFNTNYHGPAVASGAQSSAQPILQAVDQSITDYLQKAKPADVGAVRDRINRTYQDPVYGQNGVQIGWQPKILDAQTLKDNLYHVDQMLDQEFKKSEGVTRANAASNPSTAALVAEGEALRDVYYDMVAKVRGQVDDTIPRALRRQIGSLIDARDYMDMQRNSVLEGITKSTPTQTAATLSRAGVQYALGEFRGAASNAGMAFGRHFVGSPAAGSLMRKAFAATNIDAPSWNHGNMWPGATSAPFTNTPGPGGMPGGPGLPSAPMGNAWPMPPSPGTSLVPFAKQVPPELPPQIDISKSPSLQQRALPKPTPGRPDILTNPPGPPSAGGNARPIVDPTTGEVVGYSSQMATQDQPYEFLPPMPKMASGGTVEGPDPSQVIKTPGETFGPSQERFTRTPIRFAQGIRGDKVMPGTSMPGFAFGPQVAGRTDPPQLFYPNTKASGNQAASPALINVDPTVRSYYNDINGVLQHEAAHALLSRLGTQGEDITRSMPGYGQIAGRIKRRDFGTPQTEAGPYMLSYQPDVLNIDPSVRQAATSNLLQSMQGANPSLAAQATQLANASSRQQGLPTFARGGMMLGMPKLPGAAPAARPAPAGKPAMPKQAKAPVGAKVSAREKVFTRSQGARTRLDRQFQGMAKKNKIASYGVPPGVLSDSQQAQYNQQVGQIAQSQAQQLAMVDQMPQGPGDPLGPLNPLAMDNSQGVMSAVQGKALQGPQPVVVGEAGPERIEHSDGRPPELVSGAQVRQLGQSGTDKVVPLTPFPERGIIRGSSNIPLSEKGKLEAEILGQQIKLGGGIDKLHSSGLARTMQTAQAIQKHNPGVQMAAGNPAFRSWSLGELEGQPVTKETDNIIQQHIHATPDAPLPGAGPISVQQGESFNQFQQRLANAMRGVIQEWIVNPRQRLGVVTHNRDVQTVRGWLAGGQGPIDDEVDKRELGKSSDMPGGMHRILPDQTGRWVMEDVEPGKDEMKPGIYLLRHTSTDWNSPHPEKGS